MFRRLFCVLVLSANGMFLNQSSEAAPLPAIDQEDKRTESSAPDTSLNIRAFIFSAIRLGIYISGNRRTCDSG